MVTNLFSDKLAEKYLKFEGSIILNIIHDGSDLQITCEEALHKWQTEAMNALKESCKLTSEDMKLQSMLYGNGNDDDDDGSASDHSADDRFQQHDDSSGDDSKDRNQESELGSSSLSAAIELGNEQRCG